jgi:hypothetical protein
MGDLDRKIGDLQGAASQNGKTFASSGEALAAITARKQIAQLQRERGEIDNLSRSLMGDIGRDRGEGLYRIGEESKRLDRATSRANIEANKLTDYYNRDQQLSGDESMGGRMKRLWHGIMGGAQGAEGRLNRTQSDLEQLQKYRSQLDTNRQLVDDLNQGW